MEGEVEATRRAGTLSRLEWSAVAAAVAACAAKVAAAGGGIPRSVLVSVALAAGALAAAAARSPARRWIDGWRLVLVLLALLRLPGVYERVGGDGFEYYALLRSALLDGDFRFDNDYAGLGARPVRDLRGEVTSRFPVGLALLWSPAVVATHVAMVGLSWTGVAVAADGFSPPYQTAATTSSYVYGILALLVVEGLVRKRYSPAIALLTVLALWLATPLDFYLIANPSMPQGASAFAASLFVWAWLRARDSEALRPWWLVGLAGGLMVLVRGQDGVLLVIPALDLLFRRQGGRLARLVRLVLPPAVLGLLQIAVWWSWYGSQWAQIVRKNGHLGYRSADLLAFLFSARHGLFTWTPLYLAAAFGWAVWAQRERRVALLCGLGFLLACLLNGTQWDWWGGDSFGQRRMVSCTVLFGLGLAAAADFFRRRPLVLPALVVGALALWNAQLAWIYNSDLLASKGEAVSLDRLLPAQVAVAYRRLWRWERWLPGPVAALCYENLVGIWMDEGPRQLGGRLDIGSEPAEIPMVLGDHWSDLPQKEGETTFRFSRSNRSWLRFPMRTPSDASLLLRLRRGYPEIPVDVSVLVNGRALGAAAAEPSWSVARLPMPREALRRGWNEVELRYSTTPREASPGLQGRDAAIALDWIAVERAGWPLGVPYRETPPPGLP